MNELKERKSLQRSEDRARLGCGPDATALPSVIHFCAHACSRMRWKYLDTEMLQLLGCRRPPGLWAPRSQTHFPFSTLCSHDHEPDRRPRPAQPRRSSNGVADRLAARGAGVRAVAEIIRQPSEMSSYGQHRRRGQAPDSS